jgi:hypothetical protein
MTGGSSKRSRCAARTSIAWRFYERIGAAAPILLERVQDHLPQWAAVTIDGFDLVTALRGVSPADLAVPCSSEPRPKSTFGDLFGHRWRGSLWCQ